MKRTTDVTLRDSTLPAGYPEFIAELKARIRSAQVRAVVSVNRELILLYWQIGGDILARQQTEGWGAKVIDRLSRDLMHEFPDMKGFSVRNLKYMRKFAKDVSRCLNCAAACCTNSLVPQLCPSGSNFRS